MTDGDQWTISGAAILEPRRRNAGDFNLGTYTGLADGIGLTNLTFQEASAFTILEPHAFAPLLGIRCADGRPHTQSPESDMISGAVAFHPKGISQAMQPPRLCRFFVSAHRGFR